MTEIPLPETIYIIDIQIELKQIYLLQKNFRRWIFLNIINKSDFYQFSMVADMSLMCIKIY